MNYLELSKEISYALRHAPWEFELELDEQGFVPIDMLLDALNRTGSYSRKIERKDLDYIIAHSDKKRHEIVGDKIRALYGHTIEGKVQKEEGIPPAILYHGTARDLIPIIKEQGLLPMNRQYVHLSTDYSYATRVGKRKDPNPIILKIDTVKAREQGLKFLVGNGQVWLTDKVPPCFIDFSE